MGQRVLLVDADLRRPQLHRRLSLFNGQGLANLVTNTEMPLDDVIQASGVEDKLSIVTSGQRPPDPSRLLSSETMKRINQHFQAAFDLVIYDTPPFLGLSDASLLSNLCDGLILVVGLGQTDRGALKRSLETIKNGRSPLLGVVANAVKQAPGYRYYDYYYSYGYHHYYHTLDTAEDTAG
jgi:capsular exopolysaccharide synthesis family protein